MLLVDINATVLNYANVREAKAAMSCGGMFGLLGSFYTSSFGASNSQKAQAHYSNLLGFWLMRVI